MPRRRWPSRTRPTTSPMRNPQPREHRGQHSRPVRPQRMLRRLPLQPAGVGSDNTTRHRPFSAGGRSARRTRFPPERPQPLPAVAGPAPRRCSARADQGDRRSQMPSPARRRATPTSLTPASLSVEAFGALRTSLLDDGRMISTGSSRLSLWSTDSVLSVWSRGSVLSIGSIGSVVSIGSIGSAGSIFSIGSALSTGSALSWRSRWSLLADRSFGRVLASRSGAGSIVGPPAALAAVAGAACAAYLLERSRRSRLVHRAVTDLFSVRAGPVPACCTG